MAWAIQAALIWVFVSGCAAVVWIAGYYMEYRRGVRDAIIGDIIGANHRVRGD
jgi:hypothetical protein